MLNIVSLNEAVNGNNRIYDTGRGYEFYGSIHECTAEFNYMVMVEDADIQGFITSSDEILAEAVLSGDTYRVDRLSEGVFSNIKDGLSKFFEKIRNFVKGIIEKIRAFLYKLVGKTDKWLKIMKEKVLAAARITRSSNMTYEMHKWNITYVTTDLLAGVQSTLDFADGSKTIPGLVKDMTVTPDSLKTHMADIARAFDHRIGRAADDTPDNAKDDNVVTKSKERTAVTDKIKDYIDKINEAKSDFDEKWPDTLAAAVGVSAGSSVDSVWSEVAKKAKGDSNEKVEVKFCSQWGIDSMLQAIDQSKKTITDLKSKYDKHYEKLTKIHKEWDNALDKFKIDGEKNMDSTATSQARSMLTAIVGFVTHQISACETASNTARGANVKFVQDMTHEFMNALTKFASYKE